MGIFVSKRKKGTSRRDEDMTIMRMVERSGRTSHTEREDSSDRAGKEESGEGWVVQASKLGVGVSWRYGRRGTPLPVQPFLVSSGGSLEYGAMVVMKQWKDLMTKPDFARMEIKLPVGLARARAENFVG